MLFSVGREEGVENEEKKGRLLKNKLEKSIKKTGSAIVFDFLDNEGKQEDDDDETFDMDEAIVSKTDIKVKAIPKAVGYAEHRTHTFLNEGQREVVGSGHCREDDLLVNKVTNKQEPLLSELFALDSSGNEENTVLKERTVNNILTLYRYVQPLRSTSEKKKADDSFIELLKTDNVGKKLGLNIAQEGNYIFKETAFSKMLAFSCGNRILADHKVKKIFLEAKMANRSLARCIGFVPCILKKSGEKTKQILFISVSGSEDAFSNYVRELYDGQMIDDGSQAGQFVCKFVSHVSFSFDVLLFGTKVSLLLEKELGDTKSEVSRLCYEKKIFCELTKHAMYCDAIDVLGVTSLMLQDRGLLLTKVADLKRQQKNLKDQTKLLTAKQSKTDAFITQAAQSADPSAARKIKLEAERERQENLILELTQRLARVELNLSVCEKEMPRENLLEQEEPAGVFISVPACPHCQFYKHAYLLTLMCSIGVQLTCQERESQDTLPSSRIKKRALALSQESVVIFEETVSEQAIRVSGLGK